MLSSEAVALGTASSGSVWAKDDKVSSSTLSKFCFTTYYFNHPDSSSGPQSVGLDGLGGHLSDTYIEIVVELQL